MNDSAGFALAAFELALDDISDVKQFGDSYYVMKVIKKIDPVVLEFDKVKSRAVNELKLKFQKEKAKEQASIYLAKAIESKNIEQLAKDNSLNFKSTKLFTRNGYIKDIGSSQEIIKAGFSLNSENKIYPEIIENSLGFFIVQFKERTLPEESDITENIKTLKEQILKNKQAQSYQAWMENLRAQNKITYNSQILN